MTRTNLLTYSSKTGHDKSRAFYSIWTGKRWAYFPAPWDCHGAGKQLNVTKNHIPCKYHITLYYLLFLLNENY